MLKFVLLFFIIPASLSAENAYGYEEQQTPEVGSMEEFLIDVDMTYMHALLNGKNTFPEETKDLETLLSHHNQIERNVSVIPEGIITDTISHDPDVREAIVNHVGSMVNRLYNNDNPRVIVQSEMVEVLFPNSDKIETEIDIIEFGIRVTQTSSDPIIAGALQTHAKEVSHLVKRGMLGLRDLTKDMVESGTFKQYQ